MRAKEYKRSLNLQSEQAFRLSIVRTLVFLTMVTAGFTGCSLFDKAPDKTAPVVVNILPTNTRASLLKFLEGQLVDPSGVRDAYITEPTLQPLGTEPRYFVCVRYNAKDGYGQYTGSSDYIAIYFAGKLTQYVTASDGQCRSAAYQRFTELEALKKPGAK